MRAEGRGAKRNSAERPTSRHAARVLTVLRELCECAICLSLVAEPHALPRCGHSFCGSCIANWLARASTCPACRAPVSRGGAERSSALINTMWHAVRPLLPVAEREDWLQRRSAYHQASRV